MSWYRYLYAKLGGLWNFLVSSNVSDWFTRRNIVLVGLVLVLPISGYYAIKTFWLHENVPTAQDTILVSWPTVYLRERLLNETISEERSLKTELEEADKSTATITRDIDLDIANRIVAQLGIGESKQTVAPANQTGGAGQNESAPSPASQMPTSLLESLEDREALRSRIYEALAANNIYDSQDAEGQGLFRFQFSVSLLPPPARPYAAHIEVLFNPPRMSEADLENLYSYLLARESVRLTKFFNAPTQSTSVIPQPAGQSIQKPPQDDIQKQAKQDIRVSSHAAPAKKVTWNIPWGDPEYRTPTVHAHELRLQGRTAPLDSGLLYFLTSRVTISSTKMLTSVNWFGGPEEEYLEKRGIVRVYKIIARQTDADWSPECLNSYGEVWLPSGDTTAMPAAETFDCTTLILAFPADKERLAEPIFDDMLASTNAELIDIADTRSLLEEIYSKPRAGRGPLDNFLRTPNCDDYGSNISADNAKFRTLVSALVKRRAGDTFLLDPRPLFENAGMSMRYGRTVDAMLERMATAGELEEKQRKIAESLDQRVQQYRSRAEALLALFMKIRGTIQRECKTLPKSFDAAVPEAFLNAVLSDRVHKTVKGEARPLRLEPSFRPIFERRHASQSSEAGGSFAGSTTSIQAQLAGAHDRMSKDSGVITQASIISFSENPAETGLLRRNGWILEPDQPGSGTGEEWVQRPRNELLATDVALPAWWPAVSIDVVAYWTTPGSQDHGVEKKLSFQVALPGMRQDSDSLLRFLTSESLLEINQPHPNLAYPDQTKNEVVNLCVISTPSIIITGANLWHSPRVFVGSQEATSVSLLPNMQGLTAKFAAADVPQSGEVPVFVATSTEFSKIGSIKIANSNCRAAGQAAPAVPAPASETPKLGETRP